MTDVQAGMNELSMYKGMKSQKRKFIIVPYIKDQTESTRTITTILKSVFTA